MSLPARLGCAEMVVVARSRRGSARAMPRRDAGIIGVLLCWCGALERVDCSTRPTNRQAERALYLSHLPDYTGARFLPCEAPPMTRREWLQFSLLATGGLRPSLAIADEPATAKSA